MGFVRFVWKNLAMILLLLVLVFFATSTLFIPKRTVCVETFNMTGPLEVSNVDLGTVGKFLDTCMKSCDLTFTNDVDELSCVRMCFDKVVVDCGCEESTGHS